ncbi:MAG: hypothetical protein Q8N96_07785, partial [Methylovulum sp.]|nr:hypothetical protein [Methylovulum sp.]
TVKNNASTKLPHNQVYVDVSVDGVLKKTLQITKVLNAYDSGRYYYQIGSANTYRAGTHFVSIQIKSPSIIQTNTSNDNINGKSFNLQ